MSRSCVCDFGDALDWDSGRLHAAIALERSRKAERDHKLSTESRMVAYALNETEPSNLHNFTVRFHRVKD